MPKIVKRKAKVAKRAVRHRRVKLSAGKVKKKVILFAGIAVLLVGLVALQPWKFIGEKITNLSQGQAISMPKPENEQLKNITLEPEESKTVFLKAKNGATVSLYFPPGSVVRKQAIAVGTTKDETGVFMQPEGFKFKKPVSITFDLSDTSLKSDAPEKVDNDNPRTTGTTHLYSVDGKGNVTPTLIARGMETAVVVTGRTLFSGAYVLRTEDKGAEKYAKATLDNPDAYFFSTLEAAATLLGNNQQLTDTQEANAKKAVDKVLSKKSAPLFELYAAMIVNQQLEKSKTSFIGKAYAQANLNLEANLRQQCSEKDHSVETYINAELLAKTQGFHEVANLCRQTGSEVLRQRAQAVFNNPNATFEEVMVMMGQVKSIEGTKSVLLTNMENKLELVVDRDIRNAFKNPNATLDELQELVEHKAFTLVDPALSKELDRVTFVEARDSIEKILAKDCPLPSEVLYAKSLVIQYKLDDLADKVKAKKECPASFPAGYGGGGNPPPGGGGGEGGNGGGSSVPPEVVGVCYYAYSWSYNVVGDGVCQVCYDAVTDDHRQDLIESKCVNYDCEAGYGMWDRFNKACKMDVDIYDYSAGKHTDPEWQSLDELDIPDTLGPMPDGNSGDNSRSGGNEDPPIPDTLNGTGGQNNSSNDGGSGMDGGSSGGDGGSQDGGSSDGGSDQTRDPNNPYDFDL